MQTGEKTVHPPYMLIFGVLALLMAGKVVVSLVIGIKWLAIMLLLMISMASSSLTCIFERSMVRSVARSDIGASYLWPVSSLRSASPSIFSRSSRTPAEGLMMRRASSGASA